MLKQEVYQKNVDSSLLKIIQKSVSAVSLVFLLSGCYSNENVNSTPTTEMVKSSDEESHQFKVNTANGLELLTIKELNEDDGTTRARFGEPVPIEEDNASY